MKWTIGRVCVEGRLGGGGAPPEISKEMNPYFMQSDVLIF